MNLNVKGCLSTVGYLLLDAQKYTVNQFYSLILPPLKKISPREPGRHSKERN
jgi:hypothetical protein